MEPSASVSPIKYETLFVVSVFINFLFRPYLGMFTEFQFTV